MTMTMMNLILPLMVKFLYFHLQIHGMHVLQLCSYIAMLKALIHRDMVVKMTFNTFIRCMTLLTLLVT